MDQAVRMIEYAQPSVPALGMIASVGLFHLVFFKRFLLTDPLPKVILPTMYTDACKPAS